MGEMMEQTNAKLQELTIPALEKTEKEKILTYERIGQRLNANQELRLEVKGSYFAILNAPMGVDVSILKSGRAISRVRGFSAGDFVKDFDFDGVIVHNGNLAQDVLIEVSTGNIGTSGVDGLVEVSSAGNLQVAKGRTFFVRERIVPVANRATASFYVPINSGVVAFIKKIKFVAESVSQYTFAQADTPPGGVLSSVRNKRLVLGAGIGYLNLAKVRITKSEQGGEWGGIFYDSFVNVAANQEVMHEFEVPFQIDQGQVFSLGLKNNAVPLVFEFEWFEVDV